MAFATTSLQGRSDAQRSWDLQLVLLRQAPRKGDRETARSAEHVSCGASLIGAAIQRRRPQSYGHRKGSALSRAGRRRSTDATSSSAMKPTLLALPEKRPMSLRPALELFGGVLAFVWLALAATTLIGRYRFDRRERRRLGDARRLLEGSPDLPGRLSRRRLLAVAKDESGEVAGRAARALVARDRRGRIVAAAAARAGTAKRAQALRVLVRASASGAFDLLEDAAACGDPWLSAAAVAIAAESDSADSDRLLLEILAAGPHPQSRTATELEPRVPRLVDKLVSLADDPDAKLRFWALNLLSHAPARVDVERVAVARTSDDDASVRAAAVEVLAQSSSRFATASLAAGATQLAADIAPLLADDNWWVRSTAKEALLALGDAGLDAARAGLAHFDRFARDGALEVIARAEAQRESAEAESFAVNMSGGTGQAAG